MNKEIKAHIGNEISTRRKALGITQEDLAAFLDLSRVSVLNIEQGRHGTTAETLWMICAALNCTPNDLFPQVKPHKRKYKWVEKTIKVPKIIKVRKLTL